METRNAIIVRTYIVVEDHGMLIAGLVLDDGDGEQVFDCGVYAPKSGINGKNYAGHFIYQVLKVASADKWEQLKGKAVRAMGDPAHIEAVGHVIADVWFNPGKEFGLSDQEVPA
jgi:hypothetical protein